MKNLLYMKIYGLKFWLIKLFTRIFVVLKMTSENKQRAKLRKDECFKRKIDRRP